MLGSSSFGRLALYGPNAARLHEQLIQVTARRIDPSVRKGGLPPHTPHPCPHRRCSNHVTHTLQWNWLEIAFVSLPAAILPSSLSAQLRQFLRICVKVTQAPLTRATQVSIFRRASLKLVNQLDSGIHPAGGR